MYILMLCTRTCCEDGFTVRHLKRGETYNIADTAAKHLILNGWAKEVSHAA